MRIGRFGQFCAKASLAQMSMSAKAARARNEYFMMLTPQNCSVARSCSARRQCSCSGVDDPTTSALAHFAEQIVVVIVFADLRIEQHFLHIRVVAVLGLLEERALGGNLVEIILRGVVAGLHHRLRE